MILNHGKGGGAGWPTCYSTCLVKCDFYTWQCVGWMVGGGGGGGGGGGWPGTGVKPAGDLGLLYLVRHLGGPEPLHDEAGGNDATESVHTYRGMGKIIVSRKSAAWGGKVGRRLRTQFWVGFRLGWDYRGDINHQVLDNRWSVARLCIGRF